MMRRLLLVVISVLALACSGFATGSRVVLVGVMSDSMCGLKHSTASPEVAKCVIGCVAKGADYVLVSGGKIYKFEKKDDFYEYVAGKHVQVVGSLTGDTFARMDLGVEEITGAVPTNVHLYEGILKVAGGKYTLESEGKVYKIDPSTAEDKGEGLPPMAGRRVELVGMPEGDTIHMRGAQTR